MRHSFIFLIVALCVLTPDLAQAQQDRQFDFKIDPKTSLRDLLPTPPVATASEIVLLNEELAKVSELSFSAPLRSDDSLKEMAHVIAKINHLNLKNADGFMEALINQRHDLRGLPFRMGKDCRTPAHEAMVFDSSVILIRHSTQMINNRINSRAKGDPSDHARPFWQQFAKKMSANEGARTARNPASARAHAACSREEPHPKFAPATSTLAPWAVGRLSSKSGLRVPSKR